MIPDKNTNSSASYATSSAAQAVFSMISPDGLVSVFDELLFAGAKLSVVFSKLCRDWRIPFDAKWAYHRLRRQCLKWKEQGLISYSSVKIHDSCSVEPEDRPSIFLRALRAKAGIPQCNPNLIKRLQNSKTAEQTPLQRFFSEDEFANDPDREDEIAEKILAAAAEAKKRPRWFNIPGGHLGWLRLQAIKKVRKINDPSLFIREKLSDGSMRLNPALTVMQANVSKMFEAWKRECDEKQLVLHSRRDDEYLVMNYKTRFTDVGRHWENEKIYRKAIELSGKNYQSGVFITLTTDPQIHMRPLGEEFERHVNDPNTGETIVFNLVGHGGNLWSANRHESTAWRKWYEKLCHRYGFRIPYIRVVEFQKNGLIHTHVLFFGIDWNQSWEELGRDWGERYNQGVMNQVYKIVNRDGTWQWASKGEQPNDTKGRSPADYLGKYLKKASDIPTVKCPHCGNIIPVKQDGTVTCLECGTKIKAPRDGRYMYWVMGKRFFTISQCLRDVDFDEVIRKEDLKAQNNYKLWEFLGSYDTSEVNSCIHEDIQKRHPKLHLIGDINGRPVSICHCIPASDLDCENPDVDDNAFAAFLAEMDRAKQQIQNEDEEDKRTENEQESTEISVEEIAIITAEENYQRMLEIERRERAERRERLRRKREEREKNGI